MTHLTNREVIEAADRRLAGARIADIPHAKDCDICSREIELQAAILRSARESLARKAPESLNERILQTLEVSQKSRKYRWLAGNLGNIMALIGVVGMALGLATAFSTYVSPRIAGGEGNVEGMASTVLHRFMSILPGNPFGFLEALRSTPWSGAISVMIALGLLFLLDVLFRRLAGRNGSLA